MPESVKTPYSLRRESALLHGQHPTARIGWAGAWERAALLENPVVSAFGAPYSADREEYVNVWNIPGFMDGYEDYSDAFLSNHGLYHAMQIKWHIDRMKQARQELAGSDYPFMATMAAALTDPANALPIPALGGGKAVAAMAKAGKSLSGLRAAGVGFARGGALVAASQLPSEAILHLNDPTRTAGETAFNIGFGFGLGGVMGSASRVFGAVRSDVLRTLAREEIENGVLHARLTEHLGEDAGAALTRLSAADFGPQARDMVGAALEETTVRAEQVVGADTWLGSRLLRLYKWSPTGRVQNSLIPEARVVGKKMGGSPVMHTGDEIGPSVEAKVITWEQDLEKMVDQANGVWGEYSKTGDEVFATSGDLFEAVGRQMQLGDDLSGEVARGTRQSLIDAREEMRKIVKTDAARRAVDKSVKLFRDFHDAVLDSALRSGLITKLGLDLKGTALSYLARVWNKELIEAQGPIFRDNIAAKLVEKGQDATAAAEAAEGLYNAIIREEVHEFISTKPGKAGPIQERMFTVLSDPELVEWTLHDARISAAHLTRTVVPDAELAQTFGLRVSDGIGRLVDRVIRAEEGIRGGDWNALNVERARVEGYEIVRAFAQGSGWRKGGHTRADMNAKAKQVESLIQARESALRRLQEMRGKARSRLQEATQGGKEAAALSREERKLAADEVRSLEKDLRQTERDLELATRPLVDLIPDRIKEGIPEGERQAVLPELLRLAEEELESGTRVSNLSERELVQDLTARKLERQLAEEDRTAAELHQLWQESGDEALGVEFRKALTARARTEKRLALVQSQRVQSARNFFPKEKAEANRLERELAATRKHQKPSARQRLRKARRHLDALAEERLARRDVQFTPADVDLIHSHRQSYQRIVTELRSGRLRKVRRARSLDLEALSARQAALEATLAETRPLVSAAEEAAQEATEGVEGVRSTVVSELDQAQAEFDRLNDTLHSLRREAGRFDPDLKPDRFEEVSGLDKPGSGRLGQEFETLARATNDLTVREAQSGVEMTAVLADILEAYDVKLDRLSRQIHEAKGKSRKRAFDKERTALKHERAKVKGSLEHMRNEIRNVAGREPNGGWASAARHLREFNFVRFMGGVTISSLPDLAMGIFVNGFTPYLRVLSSAMTGHLKALSEDELTKLFTVMELHGGGNRVNNLMELTDQGYASVVGKKRLVDRFSDMTLISRWNALGKGMASLMAQDRVLRSVLKHVDGHALSKTETNALKLAGINSHDAESIAKEIRRVDPVTGERILQIEGGVHLGRPSQWQNQDLARSFRASITQDVNRTIVTPSVGERYVPMSRDGDAIVPDYVVKTIFQFKTFAMSATHKILGSGLQRGDSAVLQGLVALIGFGSLTEMTRRALKNAGKPESEQRPIVPENPGELLFNGIDRSGVLGIATEINNISHKVLNGFSLNTLFGMPESTRYQSRNWLDSAAGPSLGTLQDLGAVPSVAQSIFGGEASQSDVRSLRRMMPFQNLAWIEWLFNMGETGIKSGLPR